MKEDGKKIPERGSNLSKGTESGNGVAYERTAGSSPGLLCGMLQELGLMKY